MENKSKHLTTVGGQALIEGLMMIGPKNAAIAVRKPNGEIATLNKPPFSKGIFTKIPIIRGSVLLFKQLILGMRALMYSAEFFEVEEEADQKPSKTDAFLERLFGDKLKSVVITFAVIISLFMSIGLFILLPNFIATLGMLPFDQTARANFSLEHLKTSIRSVKDIFFHPVQFANSIPSIFNIQKQGLLQNVLYNILEGIVRIVIFFLYIVLAAKISPEIKRVWQYHGAEHKTIHAYENGDPLTVENIKKYPTMHPRCGTSFLFTVMIVSIIVFSAFKWNNLLVNILVRILLVPLVAGISYELFKFAGRSTNKCWAFFRAPGLMFQKFTTAEPDDSMIEVAIVAMNNALTDNKNDDKW